ncbi:MAG TPA: hypothetical protein PLL10_04610, partial [Elusimicrobiales bacterium]|nr:hypothetical protein [Elusimicrobiales bacterium]
MRICHITTAHPQFDVRIYVKECTTLAQAGFDVVLLGSGFEEGKTRGGVEIQALPKRSGRGGRLISAIFDAPFKALATKAAVFHFHDPELLLAGVFLKCCGKKVIYDAHEDFAAAALTREWIPKALRHIVSMLYRGIEFICFLFYDAVIGATTTISLNVPTAKTVTVQNYPLKNEFVSSLSFNPTAKSCMVYVGLCSLERGAAEMVKAIDLIADSKQVRLKIAGTLAAGLKDELSLLPGWSKVTLLGQLDRKELINLFSEGLA